MNIAKIKTKKPIITLLDFFSMRSGAKSSAEKGQKVDKIIENARKDYNAGNYTTHKNAKSIIAELES